MTDKEILDELANLPNSYYIGYCKKCSTPLDEGDAEEGKKCSYCGSDNVIWREEIN